MNGCSRIYCTGCGEELIHRDNRHGYESASGIGQLVHRLPRTFTVGDIDLYYYKRSLRLLRLLEHKQLRQELGGSQREVLRLLEDIIWHYTICPNARRRLHPESGVYVIRGAIDAATNGHREVILAGPQQIVNLASRFGVLTIPDTDALYAWLDGTIRMPSKDNG